MSNWQKNEQFLLEVEKPTYGGKYCPISHEVFINEIQERLDKKGMVIADKKYLTANNGQIMTGEYSIKSDDSEMNIGINFQNSYNKMLTTSVKSGAIVLVCSNGLVSTRGIALKRKHLGVDALSDVKENIRLCIENAELEFQKLILDREEMKQVQLSKKVIAELVGDMYINESLITETQLSILKKELNTSENFKNDNGWDFYNNCTEALKSSHPMNYIKSHLKVYSYLGDKFNLSNKSGLYEKENSLEFSHISDAIEYEMI